jgi:hypothetical protein
MQPLQNDPKKPLAKTLNMEVIHRKTPGPQASARACFFFSKKFVFPILLFYIRKTIFPHPTITLSYGNFVTQKALLADVVREAGNNYEAEESRVPDKIQCLAISPCTSSRLYLISV